MMKNMKEHGYNQRLFSGDFRSKLHLARFLWLAGEIQRQACMVDSVLELGCYDGKAIDFLPKKPSRYIGYDANWEGGLELAKEKWANAPNFSFFKATSPEEMRLEPGDIFDICLVMETFEHIRPHMVDGYLRKIQQHLQGYLFITVPNEKGIVFLAKYIAKSLLSKDIERHSFPELVNATLGRMNLVGRIEHKGFDYELLIKQIEKYFDVIDVSGHPLGFMPRSLCFGIGIVAKSKPYPSSQQGF